MEATQRVGVAARALAMLLHPGRAWAMIDKDGEESGWRIARYAVALAAIPAVCGVVGALIFPFAIARIGVRMNPVGLVLEAVAGYALTLVAVWLLAAFIEAIAPGFGGRGDRAQAQKLVVYSATAAWVGGVAGLYPSLGIPVGILAALYSLYALFLGLPRLMGIPDERRLTAFAAVLLAVLALAWGRGYLTSKAAELGGPLSASYAAPR